MRHRLFNIASGLSLALCVVVIVLWVRSCWVADEFRMYRWVKDRNTWESMVFGAGGGCMGIIRVQTVETDPGRIAQRAASNDPLLGRWKHVRQAIARGESSRWYEPRLFRYRRSSGGTFPVTEMFDEVLVPYWMLLAVLMIVPVAKAAGLCRRRRRRRIGLCLTCGYDLRASKEKCPECGMAIPQRPEARSVAQET